MTRVRSRLAFVLLVLAAILPGLALAQTSSAQPPLLLRNPALSQDRIAFLYADDIWTVSRQGGEAQRLTSNGKVVAGPFYSPDGASIAYSAPRAECPGALPGIRRAAPWWAGRLTAKT
jgi:tricorn protease